MAVRADTSFTGTGYLSQIPVAGTFVTNSLGQVMLKGNVHVLAMQGSNPRVTGRFQAGMDLGYQADGTALFAGPAYFELGTWQNQTNFTPTAGLWVMNYKGVGQADNSDQITITGYGLGGTIDGWRLEATATRAAGEVFDPAIPYLVSGVLKSPPVTVTDCIPFTSTLTWTTDPPGSVAVTNNQLTIHAAWPGQHTVTFGDTTAWTVPWKAWSVTQGHTLESRVRLVRLNEVSSSAILALYHDWGLGYGLLKGGDWVGLMKQSAGGISLFRCEKVTTSNTNVVLVLALTPSGQNVILTGRVLDGNSGEVLYELTAQDTPGVDPSLTREQFRAVTGMDVQGIFADTAGQPWTSGTSPSLMLDQYTDGTLPAAEATFANFELRNYEIPPIGISRAVQLSWPAAGMNYAVEAAPTVQGPWLPFQDQVLPRFAQKTVPANDLMKFFRLRQAP